MRVQDWVSGFIFLVMKLGIILVVLLTLAAYLVWVERKLLARMQARIGPNRAGPMGLLQPLVDLVKLVTKEDTVPKGASRVLFLLAPGVVALVALLIFAVVPFGREVTLWGQACAARHYGFECGTPLFPRPFLDQCLRRCPRGLGLQLKIQPDRGRPGRSSDGQLRGRSRALSCSNRHAGTLVQSG